MNEQRKHFWSGVRAEIPLLIGVFPANIRAAREEISIAGSPPTPLGLRSTVQIIFLLATIGVVIGRRG